MRRPARLATAALLLALGAARASAAPAFSTKEAGVRLSSAVLQALVATGVSAYPVRAYFIRGSSEVVSATSGDGLSFTDDTGVRLSSLTVPSLDIAISSITGLSVLPLSGGGWRMAYSVIGTTGAYRIYTATSADGIDWANDTGTAVSVGGGSTFAQYPSLLKISGSDWRMYLIENSIAGSQPQNHQIYTSTSSNEGRDWSPPVPALAAQAGAVSATQRTDGLVRLYYSAPASVGVTTNTEVLSALSTTSNGDAFGVESGVRLSTGTGLGAIDFPLVARATDTFRWRMYYDFTPFQKVLPSTADVYSAVTDSPDVQAISPTTWLRSWPPVSMTINGEVFSAAPTVELSMGGQAPIAGAVTRVSDQQLSVTFNTTNQTLGTWNVDVTDDDGLTTTLPAAFLLDFAGGDVHMVDNLIRPRNGTKTQIIVTVFNDGPLTVKLYTLDGRPVATLFDGEVAAGTHTVTWDGRTAAGNVAASGVYLARVVGPKLQAVDKIVLIK